MAGFRRFLTIVVVGAVLVVVAMMIFAPGSQRQRNAGRSGNPEGPIPVLAAEARIADVPVYLDGVGTTRALNMVTVHSQVDGTLVSVNFREGQDVKAGDVLARIDPTTYQAQLDQALAKKALDEAQLANARLDLERYTNLLKSNAVNRQQVDTTRALVAQLEAQVRLDQGAIDNARAYVNYCTIVAPISARVGIRLAAQGRGDGIRQQAGARPRHTAGRQQSSRPDDRDGAAQGRVSQCRFAALAGPIRQCQAADRYAAPGRGSAHGRRAARPQRHLRLFAAAGQHRVGPPRRGHPAG